MSNTQKVLIVVVGVCVLFFGFIIGRMGGADTNATVLATTPVTPISADQKHNLAVWGEKYPLEYNSYLKTGEMNEKPGNYGGSTKYQWLERQPEMLINFKGFGFSKDYADDRGHVYAMEDVTETLRVNEKTRGACITCKTPYLEDLYDKYGWDYAAMPFADIVQEIEDGVSMGDGSITCSECHDPATMDLRIISPSLIKGLEARGIDWTQASVDEMRSYVCAQCHVTYYMAPETFEVVFPWTHGWTVDEVWEHYVDEASKPDGFLGDWVHPDSQVAMVKDRHPDFEAWSTGVHGKAGVSCADCHMPYMTENGQKYSSHWLTSPLNNIENSCGVCHDQGTDWLLDSVMSTQENFWTLQRAAGTAVANAHTAILTASETEGVDEAELNNARQIVRKAQMYWDFVAAESSMGFHNSDQGMRTAGQALEWANEAILSAYKAAGKEL